MPDALLTKTVKASRIIMLDHAEAQALSDPVRMQILEILAHRSMTAEEVAKALGAAGYKKAVTTVRHHIDSLKRAGLIDTTMMVEVRGAVTKYYAPTVKAHSFQIPSAFEDHYSKLIQDSSSKILKIARTILTDKRFASGPEKGHECPVCKISHYREFALAQILNHAVARAVEETFGGLPGTNTNSKQA